MWSYLLREADRERGFADATQAQQDHQPTTILQHPLLKHGQFGLATIKRRDINRLPPIRSKERGCLRKRSSALAPGAVGFGMDLLLKQFIKPHLIKESSPP